MADESVKTGKIDFTYADYSVVFSITHCSSHKDFSLIKLKKEDVSQLLTSLYKIEKYTWRQWADEPRNKNGITSEIPGTNSFDAIDNQSYSLNPLTDEKYFFHFRAEQKGTFRVFGYQDANIFRITHIDPQGKMHGHK
jgi:hypothetical protein